MMGYLKIVQYYASTMRTDQDVIAATRCGAYDMLVMVQSFLGKDGCYEKIYTFKLFLN